MQAMMGIPPATAASNATVRPSASGPLENHVPVFAQQGLIRGHDILSRFEQGEKDFAGRFDASDQLNRDIDLPIVDHGLEVIGEESRGERQRPRFLQVADYDLAIRSDDRPAARHAPPESAGSCHAGADVSQSEKTHAQRCHSFPFNSGVRLEIALTPAGCGGNLRRSKVPRQKYKVLTYLPQNIRNHENV